jgi:hypothetical protein
MKLSRKILAAWGCSVALMGASLILFPHVDVKPVGFISNALQWLLFLISGVIVLREPTSKNKFIFFNFALFFGISILFHVYSFVGPGLFSSEPFARLFFFQYVAAGAYFFFLSLAIVYLTVDVLFRDFKVYQKYILALAIVGGFFLYHYHPYMTNPMYLYTTEDVREWKTLDHSLTEFRREYQREPLPQELARLVELQAWKNGQPVGILYSDAKVARVNELYPYLAGTNYLTLLHRPLYLNTVFMCVLCVGFVLLFFGYQYMKDPPQGAYMEKIMFLFLIFCTMEILHAWSFIKSVEWRNFFEIVNMGQWVSIGVLLFITLYFALRLKFITSARGEFYEQEIASSPSGVTRWRDALDDLVIAHFFNRKAIIGRLFVGRSKQE